ncbi:MAG: ankyrin repeat domain-containing protein [Opitutaceae bacterium]
MSRFRSIALACCCLCSLSLSATELSLPDLMEQGDGARVTQLLLEGADVNVAQRDGSTALIWAAYHADADALARLLIKGANPNVENTFGVQAISVACQNGDLRSFEHLLAAGADLHLDQHKGKMLIFHAARSGNVDLVNRLLQLKADPNTKIGENQTPLMWAASEGHDSVVATLLKAGADPNAHTKPGFAPIHFAARDGNIGAIQLLLQAGVDVDAPIIWKGGRGFRSPRNHTTALTIAIENAEYETGIALLEARADPNDLRSGFAPLHTMTWVRKAHTGDSSDPEPINYSRMTSLEFIDQLVEFGADVNLLANGKATAFYLAAQRADFAMMQRLVDLGADPHIANGKGTTALIVAAGVGRGAENDQAGTQEEAIKTVQLCLDLGLDINAVDTNGETAMHGAAYGQWPEMVHFLHKNGADIQVWNQINKSKWSPLLIAEGYRRGNFKPSYDTIDAIETVMAAEGVTLRYEPPGEKRGY